MNTSRDDTHIHKFIQYTIWSNWMQVVASKKGPVMVDSWNRVLPCSFDSFRDVSIATFPAHSCTHTCTRIHRHTQAHAGTRTFTHPYTHKHTNTQMSGHRHVMIQTLHVESSASDTHISFLHTHAHVHVSTCRRNTKTSNPAGFEQIDPTLSVHDYLLKSYKQPSSWVNMIHKSSSNSNTMTG